MEKNFFEVTQCENEGVPPGGWGVLIAYILHKQSIFMHLFTRLYTEMQIDCSRTIAINLQIMAQKGHF